MRFQICLTFILAVCTPFLKLGHTLDNEAVENAAHFPEESVRFSFVCLVVIIDQFCTGTIVASKAVLTSKRCLFNNEDYKNYENYKNRVHSGFNGNVPPRNYTQTIEVSGLLPYNWDNDLPKFDIMLVVLKDAFKWDKLTQPFILSDTMTFPKEKSEHCLLVGLEDSEVHLVNVGFVTLVHPDKCFVEEPRLCVSTVCSLIDSERSDPKDILTGGLVITQGMQIALLNVATPKYVIYSYVGFFRQWILKYVPQVAFHSWVHDYDDGYEREEGTTALETSLLPPAVSQLFVYTSVLLLL